VFDHLHHILHRLEVSFEEWFAQIFKLLRLLAFRDIFESNDIHLSLDEPFLQLALLGHLLAESQQLLSALAVLNIIQVLLEELSDVLD
jgi:hypothetical protein